MDSSSCESPNTPPNGEFFVVPDGNDEVLEMIEHFFPGIEVITVDGETILRETDTTEASPES